MQCTDAIIQGTEHSIIFNLRTILLDGEGNPIKDDNNRAVYIPVDLTGYTLFFTVKENLADTDDQAVIAINVDAADITDPTAGQNIFILYGFAQSPGAKDNTNIPVGTYYWDVKWLDSNDVPGAIPYKRLKIVDNVTDRIS